MLRLLADENFNGDIVRGLLLRQPGLNLIRAQDVGLTGLDDPDLLDWATHEERIVLSHDAATLPSFAFERLASGRAMAGVFIVNDRLPVHQVIEEILLVDACSDPAEWRGRVVYLFLEADPYFFGSGYVKADLLRHLKRFDLSPEDRQRLEAVILGVVRRHNRHEFTEYRRLARRLDSPTLRAGLAECRQSDEYEVRRRARWMQAALDRDEEAPLEERRRRLMER